VSRISTLPAGAGKTVLSFIHSGSSISLGILCWLCWVPGICLVGPLMAVKSQVKKLQHT
jgi:hypothetical protein